MEIRINKEIRDYQESVVLGLSARQLVFSAAAVVAAVIVYFALKDVLGTETVSWVCILCAFPLAAAGFVKYQGMTFWQFLCAYVMTRFMLPYEIARQDTNQLAGLLRETSAGKELKHD